MNIQLLKHKIGHRIWTTKQKEEQLTQFSVINLNNRLFYQHAETDQID